MEKDIWLFIEKTLEQPLTSEFIDGTICLWCKYVQCLMFHIATPDRNLKPGPHRKRKKRCIWEFNKMLQAIAMLQSEHPTAVPTFWQWWQTVMQRSPSSAERGVYSDQLHLEQDIWSEHCQNPLQSSSQPKTTRATAHQSKTGLNTSVATRANLVWVWMH